jgi:tryptophan-rich sensory protein
MQKRYKDFKTTLPKLVPSWAFGPIWSILYVLIAISSWIYLNYSDTETHGHHKYYDAVNGLLLANYVLNVSWTAIFFGFSLYWLGTITAFFIFGSAVAIAAIYLIHSGMSVIVIVGFALFIPYALYSLYAFILAFDISWNYYRGNGKEKDKDQRIPTIKTLSSPGQMASQSTSRLYYRRNNRFL